MASFFINKNDLLLESTSDGREWVAYREWVADHKPRRRDTTPTIRKPMPPWDEHKKGLDALHKQMQAERAAETREQAQRLRDHSEKRAQAVERRRNCDRCKGDGIVSFDDGRRTHCECQPDAAPFCYYIGDVLHYSDELDLAAEAAKKKGEKEEG